MQEFTVNNTYMQFHLILLNLENFTNIFYDLFEVCVTLKIAVNTINLLSEYTYLNTYIHKSRKRNML